MIRRLAVASVLLAVALPLFAQPAAPTCAKTLGITWADIKQCMQELTVRYPEQFSDAVFGYLPAGTATPIVGFAGSAFGNETDYNSDPSKDRILWQGSISKVFTHAMTLLAMERAGRSLDEPFGDFNAAAHANFIDGDAYTASRQRKAPLTVRQILTMTAGFKEMTYDGLENHHLRGSDPSFFSHFPSAASCFQQATGRTDPNQWFLLEPGLYNECMWVPSVIGDPNSAKTWKAGRNVPLWNVAQYMMRYPVTFDPVDPNVSNVYPFKYSNTASIFGAFITESLTGQTFNSYAKTNFFQPLGMNDTFYNPTTFVTSPLDKENEGVTTEQEIRIAHMLNKANGVRDTNIPPLGLAPCHGNYWCDVRDWAFTWPEGGLYTSPRNIFRFLRALRDRTLPNFSPAMYDLALNDQLAENQTWGGSRTAVFSYARNGQGGLTEKSVEHGGYPGTQAVYDPNRQLVWYFGVQRVMRHHPYFQAGGETFAEARQFSSMLTSMLENQKSDNINFFLDAARAARRNQNVLRYQSRVPPNTIWSDAYTACVNQGDNGHCEYNTQFDYNSCGTSNEESWYDLGPYQRTLTVSGSGACNWWPGTGSYTENGDGRQQNGPFRLRLAGGVTGNVKSNLYPNSYSVALWVRPNSTANASIISRAGAAAYNYKTTCQIGIENGHFVHSSRDLAGAKHTVVGTAVVPGQWYYVVGRATKNGVMSLFVNDVKVGGDVPIGDFVGIAGYDYNLGSAADGLGAFGGDVAVAAVYTQELTPAEIQRNCNGMKYRFPGASCQ